LEEYEYAPLHDSSPNLPSEPSEVVEWVQGDLVTLDSLHKTGNFLDRKSAVERRLEG